MKLQFASDLHLEFADNWRYLRAHPLQVNGDILILAGDIGYLVTRTTRTIHFGIGLLKTINRYWLFLEIMSSTSTTTCPPLKMEP